MSEINLLKSYPRSKRNIKSRNEGRSAENILIASQYGREYFDGERTTGYGGYKYDGRWMPVAEDIIKHYGLKAGSRVLDIGCAKGFLIKDMMRVCPGLEVFGLDISTYAVENCDQEVSDRIIVGNAAQLPFADDSFSVALAVNTIHNLQRDQCINALREIERVADRAYVQVDSWLNETQKQMFLDWVLTAQTFFDPDGWKTFFQEAGYSGDYFWTVTE
ncbi:MAG: class I SAM-dependent methyltransferase [Rhodospirillales bacterium]|nr:class I SAM-dependent methyltransferase [Rhodospirillales bacterium]